MTQDGILLRTLVFLLTFSIATWGIYGSFEYFGFDLNSASYFFSVGSVFFAGVFCVGRANRYLVLIYVGLVFLNYIVMMFLDWILPLSAYLRIFIFAFISYMGFYIIKRRNVVTMKLNALRKSDNQDFLSKAVKTVVKKDLPTRETNLSMIMISYAKLYLISDLLFIPLGIGYFMYVGVGYDELFGQYVMSGEAYNIGDIRDMVVLMLDFAMSVSLLVNVFYDVKRPDILGVGSTATFDRIALSRLKAEQK